MSFLSRRTGKTLLATFFVFALSTSVKAQTTLLPGDIAFSGYIASAPVPDQFSFVLLKAVTSTTVIKFTDFGWRNGTLSFNSAPSTESELTLTIGSNLAAGTEIIIDGTTATVAGAGSAGTLVHTVGPGFNATLSFTTAGDQIFAYQGTFIAPVFIAGIHMNVEVGTTAAAWDPVAAGTLGSTSEKPAALTTGTNALWFTTEFDNARYNCALGNITTAPLALASLNNPANWIANNTNPPGFTLPTGCNYLGILSAPAFTLHPVNTTVCEAANTSFTITATSAVSYQWQVDNGAGFANITNNATYSGATTTTLNITGATNSMNGYIYRCVATNGVGSTNSNPATLTVTALPINPTLLAKTPATGSVADGTPVSATFNAGSGGSGCTDDFRYTTNGGVSYLPYTPGSNISTTGLAAGTGFVFIEGRRAGCATCSGSYVVLASWFVTPLPAGATTLNAGDIGFTGYASNYPTIPEDNFSFVLLRNIGPGTVVNFTNNGWLSTNVFGAGEETITWTSNAAYPAGTEIKIVGLTATLVSSGSAGTVTGVALNLASTGDQIIAYRGTVASPTFISAIHMNVEPGSTAAAWDGPVVSANASALPTGLTTGVNCIWIGTAGDLASEFNNARYGNCAGPATLGPITTLRAALNNQANWIRDNNQPPSFVLPTGCPYLGVGAPPNITVHPSPATVCELANTSFSITATGATIYQWEVDPGTGFVSVVNNANYSGATTATLNLIATPLSFNGYIYRCIASNGSGSATSNPATLTVTALPVSPTLLAKTPATKTVPDGTPVSATFNAGSGGTGCSDDYRYTTDGGTTYLPYTPGTPISTTGLAAGSGFVFIEGRRANCSAGCQGSYTVLAAWRVSPLPAAPTTLNAGDIAFSGYTSTSIPNDEFSFVLLRNIGPGTVINFTDNGWLSTNVFGTGEQTVTWTAPAGGLPGGTEIKISALTATRSGGGPAGTVTGTALNLISTGDQVIAYRGTAASPTFISAIHMNVEVGSTNAAWDGAVVSSNASALPTGLTSGVNCIWIGLPGDLASEHNNAKYGNCSSPVINGSLVALRAALNNQANWIVDDNTPPAFTLPTACNYLAAACAVITVTNPAVTTGQQNTPFSQTFTASGGDAPYTFTTLSALPAGLSLSAAGVLSGTPTATGTFPIVVTATDASGCTGTGSTYNLVINACPVITVTNPGVTTGTANTAFSQTFTASGGTGPYTFTTASTLPTGLTLSSGGVLSGTPTQTGSFPIVVTATDANICTGNGATYTLVISCQTITVTNPVNTAGTAGSAFSETFTSANTIGAITYTTASTLPAGLTLSSGGVLSGTPTQAGPFPIVVTVTDANGCIGTGATYNLVISCPAPVTGTAIPASQSLCSGVPITTIVLGGAPAGAVYNWTRDNTVAATGIAASGSGNISGTLTNTTAAPVTVTFTITPTYYGTCTGTAYTATVTVNPNPAPFVLAGGGTFCPGTTNLTGPIDPNYTYVWERSLSGIATPNSFTAFGGTASIQAVTSSGNYRLRVTNQFGCSITDTAAVSMADYVFNGSLGAGDAQQTGRINRFAVVSTCAAPKACPGIFTAVGARFYDSYTITNIRNVPVCATIGLASSCGTSIFNVVYTNSFNPAALCTDYLADPGSSFPGTGYMEATIPANGTIVVVVHEVNVGTGCASYQLTVDVPRDLSAITAAPPSVVCNGTSTLTAPVASSYLWSPGGATTQSITTPPLFVPTTFSVTLGYGNNGCTRSDNVTVGVTSLPPTITCPANISLNNTTGQCGGIVTYTTIPGGLPAPTITYSFTGATTGSGNGDGSGSFFNVGVTAVTVTATNVCGSSNCSFTVTITDNEPPTITTGTIASCYPTVAAAEAAALAATTATDNCPGVITETASTVGTCSAVITVTVTDANSNSATTTYNTRIDNTAPTVTVGTIASCYPTVAAAEAAALAATTATDNCPGALIETASTVGTCSAVVTVTTTDGCGNATAVTYNTRIDNTPPTITCPVPITVSCANAVPAPDVNLLIGVSDNCGGTVVSGGIILAHMGDVISSQTCANRYIITRTYRATDECGNFAECTQLITVDDQTPPVLTCPADITVSCTAEVPAPNIGSVTGVSDNCGGPVTITHQGDVISAQTCANRYTIQRTYRATDACGNFAQCIQLINVNDQTPPVLTCPAPVTVSCSSAVPAPNIALVTGVSDNCGGVVTVTHQGDAITNQTCANRYTIIRTYRATDVCGNFAQCTQIITVNDQTPPVLTCPAPVTVSCASAVPAPNIALVTGVSDNCGGVVTVTHVSDVISNQTCANRYTITRTYRATDVCGNFAECTQIITVNDQTPPVLTCPAPLTVSCAGDVPAPNIALVTGVSDNCGGVVTVTHVSDVISNQTCANRYTITRTYRATDVCGNFAQCTQIITVNDQTPPVLTCPVPLTVSCAGDVPAPNIALVTGVSDNCAGVVTVTHVSDVISNQTCANRYTITRTYRATDVCGNFAQCTQIITVNDQTGPVITCPANISVSTPLTSCTAVVNYAVTATDNCGGAVTIVSNPVSGFAFPIGVTTVTSTATDACGNVSTCTFTVTVIDSRPPVITTQPVNRAVCVGTSATFSVVAVNTVSYQWQTGSGNSWNNIPGATSPTYTVNNAPLSLNNSIYRVVLTGPCGTVVFSNQVTLVVNPLPLITLTSSTTPELVPGRRVVILTRPDPPGGTFAWLFNGSPITGANGPTLGPLTVDNIGRYNVIYTDLNGCVSTSADFLVTGQASLNFWVYPNPNNGQFQVRFYNLNGEVAKVKIYDPLGQLVYQQRVTTGPTTYSRIDVNLSNAANGIYTVELLNGSDLRVGAKQVFITR